MGMYVQVMPLSENNRVNPNPNNPLFLFEKQDTKHNSWAKPKTTKGTVNIKAW